MSRAFIKETDRDDEPERPHSDLPNYIRETGLQQLQEKVTQLSTTIRALRGSDALENKHQLASLQRDLRYWQERIRRAIPIAPQAHFEKIAFGCQALLEDNEGNRFAFVITGEDESDISAGIISWASPLAKNLIGKQVGDMAIWPRIDTPIELTVIGILPDNR